MAHLPQSMNEALPSAARIKETGEWLVGHGVKYILCCWIDLLGLPKTKPVPLSDWERPCQWHGSAVRRAFGLLRFRNWVRRIRTRSWFRTSIPS